MLGLNQNQPKVDTPTTGRITPQTVMPPILPVMPAPPKLAMVVIHSRAIVVRPTPRGLRCMPNSSVM
ncbi:hypothetical protein D3C78_1179710 [compost metagenome]